MTAGKAAVCENIRRELFGMRDEKYRDFHSRLIPTVKKELVIGVRTPDLRSFSKSLKDTEEREAFLSCLPRKYYDENNLHAFFIEQEKDFGKCVSLIEEFLPYVDNWATCDMMNPKALKKDKPKLHEKIADWLFSDRTYTVRYGLRMLMVHFLDGDFSQEYLSLAASVVSDEYYVNMAVSWFFATALTKQYETAVKYIEQKRLPPFCHNKAISKACDSFCVSGERKAYLRTLKISEK